MNRKLRMITQTLDKADQPMYTLDQVRALMPLLLANFENCKSNPQDVLKSGKGASDMSKRHKQRIKIGVNESGKPVYKWADGYSIDELNDNIVRVYVENGLISKFLEGKQSGDSSQSDSCPLFKDYAEKWFDLYKTSKLKPTTCSGYRSNMRKHLFPFFGDLRLDEITTDVIQQFLNERESLARSTVHTMFILFSQIMEAAYEDRLIPSDPTKSKRLSIPSKGRKERDALMPEQLKSIIQSIGTLRNENERRMLALFVFTGMRRGEVLGLRWEDIDFRKKLIHVNRSATYAHNQPVIGDTKTRSGKRSIPLDDRLAHFLLPHVGKGYVLGGDSPLTNMVFRRTYRNIEKTVNLFDATPHIFRHSYITTLAKADVNLKTIQRISGHANISTTLNIYTHSREEEIQEAGAVIGKVLGT